MLAKTRESVALLVGRVYPLRLCSAVPHAEVAVELLVELVEWCRASSSSFAPRSRGGADAHARALVELIADVSEALGVPVKVRGGCYDGNSKWPSWRGNAWAQLLTALFPSCVDVDRESYSARTALRALGFGRERLMLARASRFAKRPIARGTKKWPRRNITSVAYTPGAQLALERGVRPATVDAIRKAMPLAVRRAAHLSSSWLPYAEAIEITRAQRDELAETVRRLEHVVHRHGRLDWSLDETRTYVVAKRELRRLGHVIALVQGQRRAEGRRPGAGGAEPATLPGEVATARARIAEVVGLLSRAHSTPLENRSAIDGNDPSTRSQDSPGAPGPAPGDARLWARRRMGFDDAD